SKSCLARRSKLTLLELQSRFSRRVSNGLHAPVINVAAAIEYNFVDPLRFCALSNALADRLRRGDVPAGRARVLLAFRSARRNQRDALKVVNYLHVNV